MKFHKAIDVWAIPAELTKHLQPGQWVRAGHNGPLGRFYGIKRSGVIVVAWQDNAKAGGKYFDYCANIRRYARGDSPDPAVRARLASRNPIPGLVAVR